MTISPPDEAQNETATPKNKASRKTAAGQIKDDKRKSVQKDDTSTGPNDTAPKAKTVRTRAGKVPSRVATVTAEERRKMIAAAAFYRAEKRGFEPGHEHEDWLLAEREIDTILGR